MPACQLHLSDTDKHVVGKMSWSQVLLWLISYFMLKVYPCVILIFTSCLCLFSNPSSVCTCVSFAHLPLCLYCQSVFFLYSSSVHLFLFRVSCVSCLPLPLSWSSCVLCVTALLSVASDFSPVFYFSLDFPSCFLLFTFLGVGLLDISSS